VLPGERRWTRAVTFRRIDLDELLP
jgi:hypothetical protein